MQLQDECVCSPQLLLLFVLVRSRPATRAAMACDTDSRILVRCSVMTKLTRAVEAYVDDFDALQLVNIMWSFGKLNINPGAPLVHRICDRLALLLVDLTPQVLPLPVCLRLLQGRRLSPAESSAASFPAGSETSPVVLQHVQESSQMK